MVNLDYLFWKKDCMESIEHLSAILGISCLDLVEFAYRNYPDDFRQDGDFDRLYEDLKEHYNVQK